MSKKRLFQVLDEMNVNDDINKTDTCGCCFDVVEAKTAKGGGHVIMGVPAEAITRIFVGEYQPFLILLNKKEYDRIEKQPAESAEQKAERYEKALKEIKGKAMDGIFPHIPIENMGAQMCIEIEKIATEALTPNQPTDDTANT